MKYYVRLEVINGLKTQLQVVLDMKVVIYNITSLRTLYVGGYVIPELDYDERALIVEEFGAKEIPEECAESLIKQFTLGK